MANQKQDGTNLINIEYSTSRCLTQCEQCFVNFGQQGTATCLGTFNPDRAASLKFIEAIGPASGYVNAPKIPAGTKAPRGYELLLRKIVPSGKGLWNVPTRAAQAGWVLDARKAEQVMVGEVGGIKKYGDFPTFLRVSSMSDTMRAPLEWIRQVKAVWGDQCFFNSAIRSVKWAVEHGHIDRLGACHKLVVTTNPGKQVLSSFQSRTTVAIDEAQKKKDVRARNALAEKNTPLGSMGRPIDRPRDFMNPQSLTALGHDLGVDLSGYEARIKFYRQRALATIQAELKTDRPVVITQMRFVSPAHAAEFSRRYGLELELHLAAKFFKKNGDIKKGAKLGAFLGMVAALPNVTLLRNDDISGRLLRIRSKKSDSRNISPHAGEWTEMLWQSSYYRVQGIAFDHEPYVCDRRHGSCKHCGLCASLDGTGPTIGGVPFCNELNVAPWGDVLLPLPYLDGAVYLGDLKGATDGDFFRAALAATQSRGDFTSNPAEPASPEECIEILNAAALYLDKGQEFDIDFCEGWNTHEDATTAIAFAFWSLVCYAQAEGRELEDVYDFVYNETEPTGIDVLEGIPELDEIWDGLSVWCDQFGETR